MLHVLSIGEFSIGELTQIFSLPQSTISRHIKVLRNTSWVKKRSEGTSSWLSFQPALLNEEQQVFWRLLQAQSETLAQSDIHKAKAVLSMRETDSEIFFQNIKERWSDLRSSLFGDSFLLPTLLALLPSHIRVIDIGCGHGETLLALHPFVRSIVGVDRSQSMIEIAHNKTHNIEKISLKRASLPLLPFQESQFDFALCVLVLQHVINITHALDEIARILTENASLIIVDMLHHNKSEFTKRMGHRHPGFLQSDFKHPLFSCDLWIPLPKDSETLGPPLFLARLRRKAH